MLTPSEAFALNLDHHGGDANTGLTFAFIGMMERYGFERVPRRTTLTFRRNGRTVVAKRRAEGGQTAVSFHLHGDPNPIVTVRPAEIRGAGEDGQRLRRIEAALFNVVEALYLATEPAAA